MACVLAFCPPSTRCGKALRTTHPRDSGYTYEGRAETLSPWVRTLQAVLRLGGTQAEGLALLPVRHRCPASQTAAGPGAWTSGWSDPRGRLETQRGWSVAETGQQDCLDQASLSL